jgi:hypothetical protein
MSVEELRGCIEQMMARDLLDQAGDACPVLRLTADGLALMKDPARLPDLVLARQRKPEKGKTLRFNDGRLSGRPPKHAESNLLAGLASCGVCGGSLVVFHDDAPRAPSSRRRWVRWGIHGSATQGRGLRADAVGESRRLAAATGPRPNAIAAEIGQEKEERVVRHARLPCSPDVRTVIEQTGRGRRMRFHDRTVLLLVMLHDAVHRRPCALVR